MSEIVRQLAKPIRAYHGSPHDFDRFDSSKIGTGEGAQAFGYGLYFAGNEDVARYYRDSLAANHELPVPHDLSEEYQRAWDAYNNISSKHSDWSIANSGGLKDGVWHPNPFKVELDKSIDAWDAVRKKIDAAVKVPGHMYEVQIEHPESALLDLDAPVESQPEAVRNALGDFASAPKHFTFGQEGWRGRNAYGRAADQLGGSYIASRRLLKAGVPGLKYLDDGSRITGDGTRNYVMFPGAEDSISILRKYGIAAPIAAGAAAGQQEKKQSPLGGLLETR
jgi:hypothetical protein